MKVDVTAIAFNTIKCHNNGMRFETGRGDKTVHKKYLSLLLLPSPYFFPGHYLGNGIEVEQPRHKQDPKEDASIGGGCLTLYATVLALELKFK